MSQEQGKISARIQRLKPYLANYLNAVTVISQNDKTKYVCPICDGGTKDKGTGTLQLNSDDTYHCYACIQENDHGDLCDLYRRVNKKQGIEKKLIDAIRELEADYLGKTPEKPKQEKIKNDIAKNQDINFFFFMAKQNLYKNENVKRYIERRGISLATASRCEVGACMPDDFKLLLEKNIKVLFHPDSSGIVIFPKNEMSGTLRYIDSKYQNNGKAAIQSQTGFYTGTADFTQPILIIAEGEFDALSFAELNLSAMALGSVSNAGDELIQFLKTNFIGKIYLALDNDKAGSNASKELKGKLSLAGFEVDLFVYDKKYKDINEYLISDREGFKMQCEKTFTGEYFAGIPEPEVLPFPVKISSFPEAGTGSITGEDHCESVADLFDNLSFLSTKEKNKKISTGFKFLDNAFSGGLADKVYTIGAVSGLGKSTLCLQVADQIAAAGTPVIYFSLEMSIEEQVTRSLSRLIYQNDKQEIEAEKILYSFNELQQDIMNRNKEYYKKFIASNLYISQENDIEKMFEYIAKIQALRDANPVVIIDYLQLVSIAGVKDVRQKIDIIIQRIKNFSMANKLPVIIISALNRDGYKGCVKLEDFKESGKIEYSSDIVAGINEEKSDRKVKKLSFDIIKNRAGSKEHIVFHFKQNVSLFEESKKD